MGGRVLPRSGSLKGMTGMAVGTGVEARVHGTVSRTFNTKNGSAFEMEVMTRRNAQWADKVTVWGATTKDGTAYEPDQGDVLTVAGRLSWSKSERDGKTWLNVALNDAALVEVETPF